MKSAVVVLALSGLTAATPEADAQILLNSPALPYAAAPSLYNAFPYNNVYANRYAYAAAPLATAPVVAAPAVYQAAPAVYHQAAPAPVVYQQAAPAVYQQAAPVVYQQAAPVVYQQAAPAVYHAAPLIAPLHPAAPVAVVRSIAPISPYRKAGDCATAEGCAVRDLIDAGLAGHKISRREADAEADPQFLPFNNFGLATPYAAAAVSPYAGLYNPYSAAPLYNNLYNNNLYSNSLYNNNLYNLGYAAGVPALNYAAAPIQAAPLAVAAPAPIVQAAPAVYQAAPAVYQQAAPAVYHAAPVVVKAAPLPLVRQPVVERITKKVTYTHIGKHPVNPTPVFETSERVLYK